MSKLIKLFAVISLFTSLSAWAGSIIVHPSNANAMDDKDVSKIFLGKSKSFADGGQAVPIDLSAGPARDEFLNNVLGKSESQLKAYWSKLIFTGKGQAPKAVDTDAEVIDLVSKNPNMIGYVSDAALNDSVKVVAKF